MKQQQANEDGEKLVYAAGGLFVTVARQMNSCRRSSTKRNAWCIRG
ncbi:hypothetical protein RB8903 [Rhodopirellula baltica SH 1]|uniref:Uncharacterized protein n=1 Tax=Rhodopirellula baltica (strain DSM 10527 / NCIMB 13988 / SH1) TaxID=243090 RepID=Q7UMC9_RHOBA|nr:hypothetical protein RB8903 [Rhodopirellula baltica SH 1]